MAAKTKAELEKELAETKQALEEQANRQPSPYDMVKIKLFRDGNHYKQPLYVGINDYQKTFERGKVYTVPRYVADFIEQTQEAEANTMQKWDKVEAAFERKR